MILKFKKFCLFLVPGDEHSLISLFNFRRKRNTADSGYGSEQPLDRRWSQEFSQEVRIMALCSACNNIKLHCLLRRNVCP